MKPAGKQFTVLINKAPFGCNAGQYAAEAVIAMAIFDQSVEVIFTDDGVFQLLSGGVTDSLAINDYRHHLKDLLHYGANRLCIDTDSARQRGVAESDLILTVEWITQNQITQILHNSDHVLTF